MTAILKLKFIPNISDKSNQSNNTNTPIIFGIN